MRENALAMLSLNSRWRVAILTGSGAGCGGSWYIGHKESEVGLMQAEVTYIHHSGFSVRHGSWLLVFDFYSDPSRAGQREKNIACVTQALHDPVVKHACFFISHSHHDHFDRDVLKLGGSEEAGPENIFIFSDDVQISNTKYNYLFMSPGQTLDRAGIQVRTFGSTDAGVSFWVEIPGLRIFHAGDLNWWYWKDESSPEELAEYEDQFKAIIADMDGEPIDIAFFPVDPRLGDYSHHGALYFIEKLKPQVLFPMHFGYDYASTARFKIAVNKMYPQVQVYTVEHERQTYQLA